MHKILNLVKEELVSSHIEYLQGRSHQLPMQGIATSVGSFPDLQC